MCALARRCIQDKEAVMSFNQTAKSKAGTHTHTHDANQGGDHGSAADANVSEFQRQMDTDMARMMQDMHSPGYSGDPDIEFSGRIR